MKIRIVTLLALILLLAVAGILTLTYLGVIETPMARIASNLGIVRSSRVVSSQLLLQQVRDVLSFQTVEYVYRSVFPHDYYPENVTLSEILNRLSSETAAIETLLSPEELRYWEAYNLAADVGLRPGRDEFVVVTVRVRGGYDLSKTALDDSEPARSGTRGEQGETESSRWITVSENLLADGTAESVLTIDLPDPEIVELVVEDLDPLEYSYPEVALHPEGWRRVAAFVSSRVAAQTVREGILERTRENSEAFLESLFRQAGYDRVLFR